MLTQEVMDFCRDFDQATEVRELESSGGGEGGKRYSITVI